MTLQRTNNNPLTAERKRDLKKLHDTIDALRDRLNIAVVYAGNKREEDAVVNITRNTRPWKSYEVVANDICTALVRLGFKNTITLKEDIHLIDALRRNNIHMVWLNTAGVQGHNPTAHAPCVLEMAGIPYVGHNPLLSTILDNKHCFKRELISYGLPTPRYMVWDMTRGHLQPDINFRFRVNFKDYKGPFVVKPVSGRASLGVEIVDHVKDLSAAVTGVYQRAQNYVIIEEFMEGKEYCVSVCSNIVVKAGELVWCDAPFVFSEIERRFEEGERIFTSMDVRPINETRARLLDPEKDSEVIGILRTIASNVFLDFDLQTLIRIDLRADKNNNIRILEANPKPDLKRFDANTTSLVAMGLAGCGMSYEDLILSLLAARVGYLLKNRSDNITHILNLL